jgi:hypothetical protein
MSSRRRSGGRQGKGENRKQKAESRKLKTETGIQVSNLGFYLR